MVHQGQSDICHQRVYAQGLCGRPGTSNFLFFFCAVMHKLPDNKLKYCTCRMCPLDCYTLLTPAAVYICMFWSPYLHQHARISAEQRNTMPDKDRENSLLC